MKISAAVISAAVRDAVRERAVVQEAVSGKSPMQVMRSANNELENMLAQLRHVVEELSDRPNGGGLAYTSLEEMIEHLEAAQRAYAGALERSKRTVPAAKSRGRSSLWALAQAASRPVASRKRVNNDTHLR